MNVEQQVKLQIGELVVNLMAAHAEIETLKGKLAKYEEAECSASQA